MKLQNKSIPLLLLPLFVTACTKVNFAPSAPPETITSITPVDPKDPVTETPSAIEPGKPEGSTPAAPVCRTENVSKSREVRVLLIVDQSGSNVNGPYEHPGASTDPQKTFRSGIIRRFVNEHGSKPHLKWGLITFNGTSANALVNNGSASSPAFASDISTLDAAITTFERSEDVGQTPYKAALAMAKSAILADREKSAEMPLYLIAFITDGYPTDYCPNSPTEYNCPGRIQEDKIDDDVKALVSAAPEHLQLGTVYYGAPDALATARLKRMSSLGNGQFVDLNVDSQLSLNDVIQVPETICE